MEKPVDNFVVIWRQIVRKGPNYLEQGLDSQIGGNGATGILERSRALYVCTDLG